MTESCVAEILENGVPKGCIPYVRFHKEPRPVKKFEPQGLGYAWAILSDQPIRVLVTDETWVGLESLTPASA